MDQPSADGALTGDGREGIPTRRVRCPRDGHGYMVDSSADPKTGRGRILRCAEPGCHMVAEVPGLKSQLLRRALLNRKQRERAAQSNGTGD